jgi:hypothetical protein
MAHEIPDIPIAGLDDYEPISHDAYGRLLAEAAATPPEPRNVCSNTLTAALAAGWPKPRRLKPKSRGRGKHRRSGKPRRSR